MKIRRKLWFILICLLTGCVRLKQQELVPVSNGRTITLSKDAVIYEDRGLIQVKWALSSGNYLETYKSPLGPVFMSSSNNVCFFPKFGLKPQKETGGFILLNDSPSLAKLFVIRNYRGQNPGALIKSMAGVDGDIYKVTDFSKDLIK